jgi:acyl carrier protein
MTTPNDARELLTEVLRTDMSAVGPTQRLDTIPNWDSLKLITTVVRLEQVLARQLSEQELERLATVGDVQALLAAR